MNPHLCKADAVFLKILLDDRRTGDAGNDIPRKRNITGHKDTALEVCSCHS